MWQRLMLEVSTLQVSENSLSQEFSASRAPLAYQPLSASEELVPLTPSHLEASLECVALALP